MDRFLSVGDYIFTVARGKPLVVKLLAEALKLKRWNRSRSFASGFLLVIFFWQIFEAQNLPSGTICILAKLRNSVGGVGVLRVLANLRAWLVPETDAVNAGCYICIDRFGLSLQLKCPESESYQSIRCFLTVESPLHAFRIFTCFSFWCYASHVLQRSPSFSSFLTNCSLCSFSSEGSVLAMFFIFFCAITS